MFFAWKILLTVALSVGWSHCVDDSNNANIGIERKGRLLGITGFLTVKFYRVKGGADSFRGGPFWKQWNAVLQINVQKTKNPRGNVIFVPTPLFYHPQGNYHPPNSFAFAGNGYYPMGNGNGPLNTQFDEAKPLDPSLSLASATFNPTDKIRSNLAGDDDITKTNLIDYNDTNIMENKIDGKTRKRDIQEYRLADDRDDREIPAEVVEIIGPSKMTENVTQAITTTTNSEVITGSTTTQPELSTTTETTVTARTSDFPFKPIHTYYYGDQPYENANQIYFTTTDSTQTTETIQTAMPSTTTSSPNLFHNTTENRSVRNAFKPSIQYEFKDSRFDIDEHFVPIVGPKQIL